MKHGSFKSTAAIIKTRDESSRLIIRNHVGHLSFPPLFNMDFSLNENLLPS